MSRIALAALALFVAAPAWAADTAKADTVKYVALVHGGKQAGEQVVEHGDDGVTRVRFVFKDNGRGPELEEQYTLNPDGTFRTYQVKGESTFGAKVDERFEAANGRATWKTTSDAGDQAIAPGAMYWPLGGTPESEAVAIAALAARADGKLPLLPGGALSMRKVDETDVGAGDGRRKVQLLAVTGVGFSPTFAWMTEDAKPQLVAFIVPGFLQLVRDGLQGYADALEARQKQAEAKALVDLHKRVAHPYAGDLLLRDVRVFDSADATLGAPSDVRVRDGRIVSVVPAATDKAVAPNVIEGNGRVLLPGLYDMHTHMDRWSGGLDIAAGVTSVRDMGNDNANLQQVIAEEKAGTLLMPRITPTGFIEGESKQSARLGFVISDLAGAKKAVDWYAAHGYPQIKIYNSFPKAILKDTVAYAHAKGMRVSGHVPAFLRAQDVIDDGFDEIQHINQLMLNFLVKPDTDTRTLERFYLPAREVADLDFDGKPVQDFIAELAKKQIAVDPTLATFEFLHVRNGQMSPIFGAVADHLPPDVQRGRRAAEMDIPDDATAARYTKSYDKMVEFVGRMYKAGVPIEAGTDETEGFTLQRELELYVKAGLTPAQALQVATRNGAHYTRTEGDRGRIAPGLRADMILVDGDPVVNISDIRNVATVVKGDTVYYPGKIWSELGVRPFADPVRVQTEQAQ